MDYILVLLEGLSTCPNMLSDTLEQMRLILFHMFDLTYLNLSAKE